MSRIIIFSFLLVTSLNVLGQVYPTIIITSDKSVVTIGETINFKASFSGGGSLPKLEWKKNGVIVGSNATNFSDNTFKDGDKIACVLTSNDPQRVMNVVASNFLSPKVNPIQINPTLSGEGIIGKAITLNSNSTTRIQWFRNDVNIPNPLEKILIGETIGGHNPSTNWDFSKSGRIFIDKCENIYVCDVSNSAIIKYVKGSKKGNLILGGKGKGLRFDQFNNGGPWDVFVDINSNIYVADGLRILKFEPGSNYGQPISILGNANALFVDTDGNIYYVDSLGDKAFKYDLNTKKNELIAGGNNRGVGKNQLSYPNSIFLDKNKSVYISDGLNNRVQRWDPGAQEGVTVAGGNGSSYPTYYTNKLSFPNDIYVDDELNIYISDEYSARIVKWKKGALEGETVAGGNGFGNSSNQFSYPSSVCLNDNGDIFVSDGVRIQKWLKNNTSGIGITVAGEIGINSSLNYPKIFDLTKNGDLYIADASRISKWIKGELQSIELTYSENGVGGPLTPADGLNVTEDGTIFVTQSGYNNVTFFTWNGPKRGSSIGPGFPVGSESNQFNMPINSFVDSLKNIYVVDSGNNRILKWNFGANKGVIVAGGNGKGSALNQLNAPNSVFVKDGFIYISDFNNSRVIQWKEGEMEGKNIVSFDYPVCVAVDKLNQLYILSNANNIPIITRYNFQQKKAVDIILGNGKGNNMDQLETPRWFKVDNDNNIYVADTGNNRIQKFTSENNQSIIPTNPGNYTAKVTTQFGEFTTPIYKILAQDTDKDGVEDSLDKCPNTPTGEQSDSNGCSLSQKDTDNDGVNDKIDKCSSTKIGFKVDSNGCADFQKDTDNDGITDDIDKCPNTPAGEQVDSNGCSASQKDADNDGVNDKIDKCSITKTGFKVDANGCADYQKDSDNDGITDDIDKCQGTPSGIKVDTFGCSEAQKDTCSNIKPTIILKNGLELSTSLIGVGYVWYLNESKIPNAINSTYMATSSGRYSVQVLKTASCITSISENIFVQITGTTEMNNQIIVFPNPFTKDIKLEFPPEFGLAVRVSISDIKGSIIYSKERVMNSDIINLSALNTGIYLLTIYSINTSEKRVFKLSKE